MSKKNEESNEHLLDLQDIIDRVIASGLDPSVFDDDIEIEYAKNVIDFATSSDFMGMETLWAKQAEQCVRMYADYCPSCSNDDFMEDVPVDASIGTFRSNVVLLNNGICPECNKNRRELFDSLPWELVSCLGQRSGKTAVTAGVLAPYYVHRFLQLPNPARFYGLMQNSFFELTFVAVTAGQVKRTLWKNFKEALIQSAWFTQYFKELRKVEQAQGLEKGTLYKVQDQSIVFANKLLGCSYAAADMSALRGSTRVFCSIDELAWFKQGSTAVRANAEETYASLSNSLRTVRSASDVKWRDGEYNTMPGMMCNISSPSSQYDKMMSLLKEGDTDPRKVTFHYSSWEASPLITRESLASEETNDPVKFWRDFGARPPTANSPFIESEQAIEEMQVSDPPLLRWKPEFIRDELDSSRVRYVAAKLLTSLNDNRLRMVPRVLTVDCGETANSYCLSIHSVRPGENDTFHLQLDAFIEAKPEKKMDTGQLISVHFPTMENLVKSIVDPITGLQIKAVLYDRWGSSGVIQELNRMRVKAIKYSPRDADFKRLRTMVYNGHYKMPRWEHKKLADFDMTSVSAIRNAPYTHFGAQFATVREIGKKIVKPEAGEDDGFRTAVLAAYYVSENPKEFYSSSFNPGAGQSQRVGTVAMKSSVGAFRGANSRNSVGSVIGKFSYKKR